MQMYNKGKKYHLMTEKMQRESDTWKIHSWQLQYVWLESEKSLLSLESGDLKNAKFDSLQFYFAVQFHYPLIAYQKYECFFHLRCSGELPTLVEVKLFQKRLMGGTPGLTIRPFFLAFKADSYT